MKAWIADDWSEPEGLSVADVPAPVPGPDDCLVRVAAAALNFSDLLMIRGRYQVKPPLPFTPGQEIAGTIVSAPAGSGLAAGDRVASKVFWGGFAEYAAVPAAMPIRLPDSLPFDEAACLPVVYPTSHIALHARAGLRAGETVLVHAAAGGVGLAAVEIAAAAGARVIATAGSDDKCAIATDRGADVALNYRDTDWVTAVREATDGAGADVIFDPVGGAIATDSLKCIAWGGRLLIVGFASGTIPELNAARLLIKNASALGVYWSHERDAELVAATVADLLALHARGAIRPLVGGRYGFDDVPAALRDLEARGTAGKAVVLL